jgi:hypothetical protein
MSGVVFERSPRKEPPDESQISGPIVRDASRVPHGPAGRGHIGGAGRPTGRAVEFPPPSSLPPLTQPATPPVDGAAREPAPARTDDARPPAAVGVNTTLIPGRTILFIDLLSTLRLAGERGQDIAIARQRIDQSLADLSNARALWLPSLFLGPTYYRADGQVQTVTGQVQNVNRSSLFLGGTASSSNGFPAPSPGTGYPQLNGLSSVLRISDAIFLPLAARRVVSASRAGFQARTNDALLEVAEAYLDLQLASGRLAIAREAADNSERLSRITETYSVTGQGQEADHRRALAELKHQRKNVQLASGQLLVASTTLIRLLVLDARLVVAPVEPAEAVLCLIPEDTPLDDLLIRAMQNRPELAQSRELVQAAVLRLKQARLRPFIPSVGATYAGGGEGGGPGSFFGNFGARGDFIVTMFWEVQHLGFGDRAVIRRNAADRRVAEPGFAQVGAGGGRRGLRPRAAHHPLAPAQGVEGDRRRGPRIAPAQFRQPAPGLRPGPLDTAHRGASADPGAGPGSDRLTRVRHRLQSRPVPAQASDRTATLIEPRPARSREAALLIIPSMPHPALGLREGRSGLREPAAGLGRVERRARKRPCALPVVHPDEEPVDAERPPGQFTFPWDASV